MNFNVTQARGESLIAILEKHGYIVTAHEAQVQIRGSDKSTQLPAQVAADVNNYRGSILVALTSRVAKARQDAEMAAKKAAEDAQAALDAATKAAADEEAQKAAAQAAQAALEADEAAKKAAALLAEAAASISHAAPIEQPVDPIIGGIPGFADDKFGTE